MSKVIHQHTRDANHLSFDCPACGEIHSFNRTWSFNDDFVRPTVTPSILVYETPAQPRCHSLITAGKIYFYPDSNHEFADKEVDLIPWTRVGNY